MEPLLAARRVLRGKFAKLHRKVLLLARDNEVCQRLMTIPGVGPVVSLAFISTVDVPARFRNSKAVGPSLGLTPVLNQSRESHRVGRISLCTTGKERRIKRWEHEAVIDAMQDRLDRAPKSMRVRSATVEHPFGTLKALMGATHVKTRTLEKVRTEMSLHVLAYNLKRVIAIVGAQPLMEAMRA